jgi:hypothetical protein
MRIGYIGHFGEWHTEWGVSKALSKKAEVDRYCYNSLDRTKFLKREYDIVLTTVPYGQPIEFWKKTKALKIAHYFDLIVGWQGREKLYFPPLRYFDMVLSTDGSQNKAYKETGIKRRWFKQAYNPEWYYPVNTTLKHDVGFIGGAYNAKRRQMIYELNRRYDFVHYGKDGKCRGTEHSRAVNQTKIMVCDNAVNDLPGYYSNRVYLHLACGGFVLHPRVPDMEKVFEDNVHLVYYNGHADLFKKINHYLDRPHERKRIAQAGRECVSRYHTWDARMEEFWEIISNLA